MTSEHIKISFGGDLMCLLQQNEAVLRKYGEYRYDETMEALRPIFSYSDYVVANLETPISSQQLSEGKIIFNTPVTFLHAIKNAGIHFVGTSNNHCLDRGIDGLNETLNYLDKVGIEHSGTYLTKEESEKIFIKEIGGIKVAFVCCTYGTNSERNGVILPVEETWRVDLLKRQNKKSIGANIILNEPIFNRMIPDTVTQAAITNSANFPYIERIKQKIERGKTLADIVIVLPHIGGQYNPAPGLYTKYSVQWLSQTDCNLIVATHSHVPQRTEWINGVLVAYSLGNLTITPAVGNYLPNVFSEYGIILHTFWNRRTKQLDKTTFSIVKNIVDECGVASVHSLYELYHRCDNAIKREGLAVDNEAIVNRIVGANRSVEIEKEYQILKK